MTADLWVAAATFGLVLVTALLALITLKGIRDQLWLMTFAEYTRRYSDIMHDLPYEARRPGGTFTLAALPVQERQDALRAMRRYLNLCSEELYLHRRGKFDKETWSIWLTGIRDTVRLPCFHDAWILLRPEYDYYKDFCKFIDELGGENAAK